MYRKWSVCWAHKDPEKARAYWKEYYRRPGIKERKCERKFLWPSYQPEKQKERKLRSRYNLSLEQLKEMVELQAGLCQICCAPMNPADTCVDHHHGTGAIRGLLCSRCNVGLGFVERRPRGVFDVYLDAFNDPFEQWLRVRGDT